MALELRSVMLTQAEEQMLTARAHVHFHLSKAVALCVADLAFGETFDREMAEVARWRAAWREAQSEYLEWCSDGR